MARTHRPTARWTAVTLLHTLLIAAIGYGTHQALPAAMGWIWRWLAIIAVTLTASLAADRPLGRLYGTTTPLPSREPRALTASSTDTDTEAAR